MNASDAPARPARFVHVVNLGAFSDFGKQCRSMAMDLYPASSGVLLHDIDVPTARMSQSGAGTAGNGPGKTGLGLMEPWLRRFENFETFLQRLVETVNRNQIQHHAAHQATRTSHSVIFCVAPGDLTPVSGAKAAQAPVTAPPVPVPVHRPSAFDRSARDSFRRGTVAGAMVTAAIPSPAEDPDTSFTANTIPAILRGAVRRLNLSGSPDMSLVIFCGLASADSRRTAVSATLARMLWNAPTEGTVHHSRNGVIGITADDTQRNRFLAMRALVDIMHSNRWDSLRMTSQRLLGLAQDLSRVSLLHLDSVPEQTTADVVAKVLESELGANQAASDIGGDDRLQSGQLKDFADKSRQAIERLVPLGQNDLPGKVAPAQTVGTAKEKGRGMRAATERGTSEPGKESGDAARRHPALAKNELPAVPQLELPPIDEAIRQAHSGPDVLQVYLRNLADWHGKALQKLVVNYAEFTEIDRATEAFKTRQLPADSKLVEEFDKEREAFRLAIASHQEEAENCRTWVAEHTGQTGSETVTVAEVQLPNLPALAKLLEREAAYRTGVLRTPSRYWPVWFGVSVLIFVLFVAVCSLLYWAETNGYAWANLNPWALWNADGDEASILWTRVFLLLPVPLALGVGGVASIVGRSVLTDRRTALIEAAEDLSLQVEHLPVAEFAARRHGVAAQRLAAALARLETCQPDRGNKIAASDFHPYRQFVIADSSWQADVQRRLRDAYASRSSERNLKNRVKLVLADAALFSGTPPVATFGGQMTCAAGGFEDTWTITHSLGKDPAGARWVPVAATEAHA